MFAIPPKNDSIVQNDKTRKYHVTRKTHPTQVIPFS